MIIFVGMIVAVFLTVCFTCVVYKQDNMPDAERAADSETCDDCDRAGLNYVSLENRVSKTSVRTI